MKIAVVTGGAGFIGSHMVDLLLEEGYRVHVIDNLAGGRLQNLDQHSKNPNLVVEIRDIREIEANDALFKGARSVFHFAGIGDIVPSIERPVDYLSTNVMGTVRVLEAARSANVRKLVYAASSSCYGLAEVPTTENAPTRPEYPYALSKFMGEEAVLHWGKVYKLPVNSIRIFNAYGIRSRTSGAYGQSSASSSLKNLPANPTLSSATVRNAETFSTLQTWRAHSTSSRNRSRSTRYTMSARASRSR